MPRARKHAHRCHWIRVLCLTLGLTALFWARTAAAREPDIELFTRDGCPRCVEAKAFVHSLAATRPELTIAIVDVGRDSAARTRLSNAVAARGVAAASVPSMLIRGTLVVGWSAASTPQRIDALLAGATSGLEEQGGTCSADEAVSCGPSSSRTTIRVPLFGSVDVNRLGLPLFTLAVGLVDGFNPCAMWVLLLLLALLVNLKSRSRMAMVAGVFVVVSGLAYFAFMAAWLNVFLLVGMSRGVQVILGLVAIGIGSIHLKDFFAFKKGVSLSIPERAKPGIYARIRAIVQAEHLVGALAAASVLAVMVNMVELLCTAGLPALYTDVLASHGLSAGKRYAYLALYVGAYMADDTFMVIIAVVTLSRKKLQERAGRWLKLVSGGVILLMGVLLVVRPQWLSWV